MGFNPEMRAKGGKAAGKGSSWLGSPWDLTIADKMSRKYFTFKVQSTISICVSMVLFTILLFVWCTVDPGKVTDQQPWLAAGEGTARWRMLRRTDLHQAFSWTKASALAWEGSREGSQEGLALQGMGILFRRGSRGMHELFVAHLSEATASEELRIYLRTLHRSGIPARADVVLLFPGPVPPEFSEVIRAEERSFRSLVLRNPGDSFGARSSSGDSPGLLRNSAPDPQSSSAGRDLEEIKVGELFSDSSAGWLASNASVSVLNLIAYRRSAEASIGPVQPNLWGDSSTTGELGEPPSWAAWGSIVSFELQELDPTETLRGFIDKPGSQLRRWICYQMILGMVKMNYKHVILAEVGGVMFLGDILASLRKRDGLCLATEDRTWNDSPAAQEETLEQAQRGVARLVNQEAETEERLDDEVVERTRSGEEIQEEGAERSLLEVRRRRRGTKRRRKQSGTPGLIEDLYGKQLWRSLEKEEKEKAVISSAIVMGGIRPIRTLTNSMATEIVRVALQRKNRHSFHDKALINYLVYKSSVLGGKVLEHIKLVTNKDPLVHVLQGSQQHNPFTTAQGPTPYRAVVGYRHEKQHSLISELVQQDLCGSPADAAAYTDCRATS